MKCVVLLSLIGGAGACSRTELVVGTVDVNDASRDVPSAVVEDSVIVVDDGPEPDVDAVDVPVQPRCRSNEGCNDGVECTIDECNFADGMCVHRLDLSRCGCDPTCRVETTGRGGHPFSPTGSMGTAFDPAVDGLIVRASERQSDLLWIPNTGENTLSKWDARLEREVARYRVGLPSCANGDPNCNALSRVVVDSSGNAVAANRAFGFQGSIDKIAAERADCVDRNGNGVIDTSTGPMDLLPFGGDECHLFNAEVGPVNAVLRSVTIDRGDATFPEGYIWVGGCANTGQLQGGAGLWQINPRTGRTIRHIDFPACAYGAVATSDGHLWWHTLSNGITEVDPVSGRVGTLQRSGEGAGGNGGTYGITADADGRIWVSRAYEDAYGYDPRLRQWTWANVQAHPNGRGSTALGISVDNNNHVWVAGPSIAYEWDARAFRGNGEIPMRDITVHRYTAPANFESVSGLGADRRGRIWMATSGNGPLVQLDPATNTIQTFGPPNRVYTYADFTGAVRRLVISSGTYTETYDTGCVPDFAEFSWSAVTPPDTSIQFTLRTATTQIGLAAATPVSLGVAPGSRSPVDITAQLLAAGVTPGRFASILVTVVPNNAPIQSPVLESMTLSWRCP